MEHDDLFQEGSLIGKVLLTGIIYKETQPRQYLLVRDRRVGTIAPGEFEQEPWTVPGGHLSHMDIANVPRFSLAERNMGKVEWVIQRHVNLTLGFNVVDIEYLLDPNWVKILDVPVMGYYAKYYSGRHDEKLGFEVQWVTLNELQDRNSDPIAYAEIKALDNIFREREMYKEIENEINKVEDEIQRLESL